jgi:hypothetical protein
MTLKSIACDRREYRASVRDGLTAAAAMLAVTWLLKFAGTTARSAGWPAAGDALGKFAFLAALTLSMPLWVTKGQPWKAQAAILIVTLAFLAVLAALP